MSSKARAQKAFMYGLLGSCLLGFAAIVLVGVLVEDAPFSIYHRAGKSPIMGFQRRPAPKLEELTKAFKPNQCFDGFDLDWTSGANGQIYVNDKPFFLKGVSYIGCEGNPMIFTGLNQTSIDDALNWVMKFKFNLIRIPFSTEFALSDEDTKPNPDFVSEDLHGKSIFEILEMVIDKAAKRGILIMLDNHDLQKQTPTPLWYDEKYTEADVMEGWKRMMTRYGSKWNVAALDLKNEPHDIATWGNTRPATDYNKYYERLIEFISTEFPDFKGLYLVEGIQRNPETDTEDDYPFWWGGNFGGAREHPITVKGDAMKRVVYSPHVYGPDVYEHNYFKGKHFKDELPKVYDSQLGWLVPELKKAVIIGEWGATMKGKAGEVQDIMAKYLVDNCMYNNVWWAMNPDSGDTGGLMNWAWDRYDAKRLAVTTKMIPDPSQFGLNDGKLCFHQGTWPNKDCAAIDPFPEAAAAPAAAADDEEAAAADEEEAAAPKAAAPKAAAPVAADAEDEEAAAPAAPKKVKALPADAPEAAEEGEVTKVPAAVKAAAKKKPAAVAVEVDNDGDAAAAPAEVKPNERV